jgi:O-glycosyl hydrolase
MKTNNNENNGGYLCGVSGETCTSGDWKKGYADYLIQYMKFYQQEGIQFTHVGFLNEPQNA